jgi:hypothetical protein
VSDAITADAYAAWRLKMFDTDYMIWHDGLNADAVMQTAGEERKRALEMLYFGLAQEDHVAVEVLGLLRETAALPQMRAILPRATGVLLIRTAVAIYKLAGDVSPAPALIAELKADHWGRRLDAAQALALFGTHPDVVPALLAVVRDDHDFLPRHHAANSLCAIARVRTPGIQTPDATTLSELTGRKGDGGSRGAREWRGAAAETFAALFR